MPAAASANQPVEKHLDLDNDDEEYISEEDEDFQLEGAGQDESEESSEEEQETGGRPAKRRKLGVKKATKTDEMELDSGDEAMIKKAKEMKKNKVKGAAVDEDEEIIDFDEDEEAGIGGFVKTRSMRMRM